MNRVEGSMEMTNRIVVVVDDEPHIRHIISRKLQGSGYEVQTACDGAEGLDLVKIIKPALLITDLQMPKMDGLEVCAVCRNELKLDALPIILLTGSVTATGRLQSDLEPFDNIHCVSKPFSPSELLRKVQQLLEANKQKTS